MRQNPKSDFETASLFVVLGILTLLLVFGAKWVFSPPAPKPISLPEVHAEKP